MKNRIPSIVLFLLFLSISSRLTANITEWKGIASFNGTIITTLAKHPDGKIYAATYYDGLYVSDDNGGSWKLCYQYHTNLVLGMITALSIDSTGNIYINIDSYAIQKSSDGGKTFVNVNFPQYDSEGVFSITTDKDGNLFVGTKYSLYFSKNQGTTWTKLLDTSNYYIVRKIYIDKGILYVLVDQSGIFKSYDYGKTWTIISLPWALHYWSMSIISENEIYVAMTSPPLPYVVSGLFKTTDGGNSWNQLTNGLNTIFIHDICAGKNNSMFAFGILGKAFKSEDSGASWEELTSGMSAGCASSVLINKDRIITGNVNSGITISDDNGKTWNYSNNGFNPLPVKTAAKLKDGTYLIANNAGLFQYIPESSGFIGLNNFSKESRSDIFGDLSSLDINGIVQLSDNSFMIAIYNGMLMQTSDNGKNWQSVNMPYHPSGITFFEKSNSGKLYFNSLNQDMGFFSSNDNGLTWNTKQFFYNNSKAISEDAQGNLLAGNISGLYFSSDEGNSWSFKKDFIGQINYIKLTREGVLYLLTEYNGAFRSSDNGVTWSTSYGTDELDRPIVFRVSCNQLVEMNDGYLLMATDNGLYETKDNGLTWTKRNDELKNSKISKLIVSDDGLISAITDKGIFTAYNTITSVDKIEIPAQFQLLQNYPNPFNPATTISYSIPKTGFVTLKIYDMLGREVETLVNENKTEGVYKVKFDADRLSSGVYIYSIRANNLILSKKMMLMK
jgi:photosystem II stability/assembly factor-like uncharacterized protein